MDEPITEIKVGRHTLKKGDKVIPPQAKADYHEDDRDCARVVNALFQQGEDVVLDSIYAGGKLATIVCRDYCLRCDTSALKPAKK